MKKKKEEKKGAVWKHEMLGLVFSLSFFFFWFDPAWGPEDEYNYYTAATDTCSSLYYILLSCLQHDMIQN